MNAFTNMPQQTLYAIVRIEKIKSVAELERRSAHNDRTNLSENVNTNAPKPLSLLPGVEGTLIQRAKQVLTDLEIDIASSEGKIIACEMIMTASKDFFAQKDPAKFDDWVRSSLKFAKQKFGRGLVDVVLHSDEEVPHIHCVGVPVVERQKLKRGAPPRDPDAKLKWEKAKRDAPLVWTLSFESVFGGARDTLSELQDDYHSAVQHLGLSRGRRNRSTKTIQLGDGIQIDGASYSRGQNADGTERPRRNIAPQEYREIIKQATVEAELDAEQSLAIRREIESRLDEVTEEAKKAAQDRHSAAEALKMVLAEKLTVEAACRAQIEIANARQLEAERLLNEAKAEKVAAKKEAEAVKAQIQNERDALANERVQDQLRLSLLEKAVDDRNKLNLCPEGDSFRMDEKQMTVAEQTVYRGNWPQALFEIARKLAVIMANIRRLWKIVSDNDRQVTQRVAEAQQTELAQKQKESLLDGREQNLFNRELSVDRRDKAINARAAAFDVLEADLNKQALAAGIVEKELEIAERKFALQNGNLINQNTASEQWAQLLTSAMKGEFYIVFDDGGKPILLVPDDDTAIVPPAMQACIATEPPAWAKWALKGYDVLQHQVHAAGRREEEAADYAKELRQMIEKARPELTPKQVTEVDQIQKVLHARMTPAEIAAHTQGGNVSR